MEETNVKKGILFSVIVPIYNAEQTIERTIQSILKQTFQNYELLLVDDCSTDNSYAIAQKYDDKYTHVHAIRMSANSGSAKAPREFGANLAKGKYVVFIDSDDVVNEVYLEGFYDTIKKVSDIDVVIPIMKRVSPISLRELGCLPHQDFDMTQIIPGPEACRMVMTKWTFGCNGCCCCELFKSVIKKNPYYYMNSDEFTSRLWLYYARNVAFAKQSEYIYYVYDTSITHKRSVKLFETLYTDTQLITFSEMHYDEALVRDMCSKMLTNMICLYKANQVENQYTEVEQNQIKKIFGVTFSFLQHKRHYISSLKMRLYLTNRCVFASICKIMAFAERKSHRK